jgi:hypothetical protein
MYFGHGSHGKLLFKQTGEFEGETEFVGNHTGIGWIAVEADGDWSLDLD